MNVTDKTTKTVATGRAASAHLIIALAVMSIFLGSLFVALNLIMNAAFAVITTFAITTAIMYVVSMVFVPGARPVRR